MHFTVITDTEIGSVVWKNQIRTKVASYFCVVLKWKKKKLEQVALKTSVVTGDCCEPLLLDYESEDSIWESEAYGDLWKRRQINLFSWLSGPSKLFDIGVGVVFYNDEPNNSNYVVSRNYSCNVRDL